MLLSNSILAFAAILASQVQANDSTKCYTAMTNKKPAGYPPTKYSTHYTPCTTTVYSTKVTTSTPLITRTETIKSYITVNDLNKKVSTTTKTVTVGTTKVITATSTVPASTTIQTTKTITKPAPANFTPIRSSLPGAGFDAAKGGRKRSAQDVQKRTSPPKGYGLGKTYPKEVVCHKYTQDKHCAAKKVTKTKTITAYPSTVIVKSTKAVTTTKCPGAGKTVTATATVTATSTSTAKATVTSTSTATSFVASTTINQACIATANYANQASGMPLAQLSSVPEDRPVDVLSFDTDSSFTCCNVALNPPDTLKAPQIFSWSKGSTDTVGLCEIVGDATTCGATQAAFKFEALNEEQAGPRDPEDEPSNETFDIAIGNAACGLILGPQTAP